MKRIFFLFILMLLMLLPASFVLAQESLIYPKVKRIKWLKNKTEVIVPIPPFFKTNTGVLVTEQYGKNVSTFGASPISSDTISLQFKLFSKASGLAFGKYRVKFAFCKEGVEKISKKDCGPVLKRKINYKK